SADGGHLDSAVLKQRLERRRLFEDWVAAEVGAECSLRVKAVAGRADPVEGHLPEVGGAVRLRRRFTGVPRLEIAARDGLDGGEHVWVLVAAEFAALALERPGPVGATPEVVRLAGDRVELALERRDPPAVVDVLRIDDQLDVAMRRHLHP